MATLQKSYLSPSGMRKEQSSDDVRKKRGSLPRAKTGANHFCLAGTSRRALFELVKLDTKCALGSCPHVVIVATRAIRRKLQPQRSVIVGYKSRSV